ncbi:uncharacterized protein V6R79_023772 [Siganus canaliculatus]
MDPSAKAPLGSQLPDQGEDTRKRKRESEDPEEPRKRSRETLSFSQGPSQRTLEDSDTVKRGNKRKREDSELANNGQNCSNAAVADPSGRQGAESEIVIISSRDSSCAKDQTNASLPCEGTSSSNLVTEVKSSDHYSKVEFEAKYTNEMKIGQGAFGSVFAGYRNSDHLPVAIKYIPHREVKYTQHEGEERIPLEVALMLRVKDVPAVITLLDWYDLGSGVVLVLERPEKCTDLYNYVFRSKGGLREASVKSIIQQLVDAFVEIHSRGVLHRDLHLENVLMELGSTVPRARVIDFGFGRFTKSCQPLTVYQIGKVLRELMEYSPNGKFTKDCNDFHSACLESEDESSVQGLKRHPWFNQTYI